MLVANQYQEFDQPTDYDFLGAGGTIYTLPIGPGLPGMPGSAGSTKTLPASMWPSDEVVVKAAPPTSGTPAPKTYPFIDFLKSFTDSGFRYLTWRDANKFAMQREAQGLQQQIAQMPDGTYAVYSKKPIWENPWLWAGVGVAVIGGALLMSRRGTRRNPPRRRRRSR